MILKMANKDQILAEHKEQVRRNRMRPTLFWKITTIVFLILFIGAIYFNGMPSFSNDVGQDEALQTAVAFINENMLMGLASAEVQEVSEDKGMYKIDLLITSDSLDYTEEFTSYVTKDGKLLFPTAVDLGELQVPVEEDPVVEDPVDEDPLAEIDYSGDPVLGNPEATVTIVEYSDFECPFCSNAYWTMRLIEEDYADSVKIIFKQFPLSFHANAQKAAEASECAFDQDMFWEYHNMLFENQEALSVDDLKQYAVDLGLNTEQFNTCLDSGEKADEVAQDMEDGSALGVTGTPAFFINGQSLVGAQPYEAFQAIIDAELATEEEPAEEEPVEEDPVVEDPVDEEPVEEEPAEEEPAEEEPAEEPTGEECSSTEDCPENSICFSGNCIEIQN
tara:strand:- start:386 stop:1558 length:1173 start_codon:yes stop_codon:yes gene_type:complete